MLVQITPVRVRKKTIRYKNKTEYTSYIYYAEGSILTTVDMETFQKIAITWSDNMNAEDISKVKDKWKHKL